MENRWNEFYFNRKRVEESCEGNIQTLDGWVSITLEMVHRQEIQFIGLNESNDFVKRWLRNSDMKYGNRCLMLAYLKAGLSRNIFRFHKIITLVRLVIRIGGNRMK